MSQLFAISTKSVDLPQFPFNLGYPSIAIQLSIPTNDRPIILSKLRLDRPRIERGKCAERSLPHSSVIPSLLRCLILTSSSLNVRTAANNFDTLYQEWWSRRLRTCNEFLFGAGICICLLCKFSFDSSNQPELKYARKNFHILRFYWTTIAVN